jgi:hypothetical protein
MALALCAIFASATGGKLPLIAAGGIASTPAPRTPMARYPQPVASHRSALFCARL